MRSRIKKTRMLNSKLRDWRLQQGLTLSEVSDLSGFTVSMLSLVERGKRRFSRKGKVMLARRLNVPLRTLFNIEQVNQIVEFIPR